ncbi:hypothetical protein [Bifidobacterium vespertilionis]|uniref:hypothetical protein n=1 Tax=Bifidobacterium vespertilionis TaxID=2562524 RepID=UPI001687C852|nr:hypothetical protein [Bifidobacterium vespertilionis]
MAREHDVKDDRRPLVERYPHLQELGGMDDDSRLDTMQATLNRLLAELDAHRD